MKLLYTGFEGPWSHGKKDVKIVRSHAESVIAKYWPLITNFGSVATSKGSFLDSEEEREYAGFIYTTSLGGIPLESVNKTSSRGTTFAAQIHYTASSNNRMAQLTLDHTQLTNGVGFRYRTKGDTNFDYDLIYFENGTYRYFIRAKAQANGYKLEVHQDDGAGGAYSVIATSYESTNSNASYYMSVCLLLNPNGNKCVARVGSAFVTFDLDGVCNLQKLKIRGGNLFGSWSCIDDLAVNDSQDLPAGKGDTGIPDDVRFISNTVQSVAYEVGSTAWESGGPNLEPTAYTAITRPTSNSLATNPDAGNSIGHGLLQIKDPAVAYNTGVVDSLLNSDTSKVLHLHENNIVRSPSNPNIAIGWGDLTPDIGSPGIVWNKFAGKPCVYFPGNARMINPGGNLSKYAITVDGFTIVTVGQILNLSQTWAVCATYNSGNPYDAEQSNNMQGGYQSYGNADFTWTTDGTSPFRTTSKANVNIMGFNQLNVDMRTLTNNNEWLSGPLGVSGPQSGNLNSRQDVGRQITLGARLSIHGSSWYFNGYLGEVIIFNRRLLEAEARDLSIYLHNKWEYNDNIFPPILYSSIADKGISNGGRYKDKVQSITVYSKDHFVKPGGDLSAGIDIDGDVQETVMLKQSAGSLKSENDSYTLFYKSDNSDITAADIENTKVYVKTS